jgi:hypothetical protein
MDQAPVLYRGLAQKRVPGGKRQRPEVLHLDRIGGDTMLGAARRHGAGWCQPRAVASLAEVLVYVLDGRRRTESAAPISPQLAWESGDLFALPSPHDRVWLHADASHAAALLVFDNAPLVAPFSVGVGTVCPAMAPSSFHRQAAKDFSSSRDPRGPADGVVCDLLRAVVGVPVAATDGAGRGVGFWVRA